MGHPISYQAKELRDDLLALTDVHKIHFTGQSLGGALAQYAAYDYFDGRVSAAPETHSEIRDSMTVTTFNGLMATEALSKSLPEQGRTFDINLLKDVDTAHFHVTNDLVHRLGGGNLNGATNEYLLDFLKTDENHKLVVRPNNVPLAVALNYKDSHRIESGFYRGFNLAKLTHNLGIFNPFPLDFTGAKPRAVQPLDIGGLATMGVTVAWLTNQDGALATKTEAWARTIAALTIGIALGKPDEVRSLAGALGDNLYAANEILTTTF